MDFVLVLAVLLPLVLGVLQLALVLHVRNTLASAAAEAAREAATLDGSPSLAVAGAREQISTALSSRYAGDISLTATTVAGVPAYRVEISAVVPALGLGGPGVRVRVTGSSLREQP